MVYLAVSTLFWEASELWEDTHPIIASQCESKQKGWCRDFIQTQKLRGSTVCNLEGGLGIPCELLTFPVSPCKRVLTLVGTDSQRGWTDCVFTDGEYGYAHRQLPGFDQSVWALWFRQHKLLPVCRARVLGTFCVSRIGAPIPGLRLRCPGEHEWLYEAIFIRECEAIPGKQYWAGRKTKNERITHRKWRWFLFSYLKSYNPRWNQEGKKSLLLNVFRRSIEVCFFLIRGFWRQLVFVYIVSMNL